MDESDILSFSIVVLHILARLYGEQTFYDDAVAIIESIPQIDLGWLGK